ncbi:hypothetical protein CB0940_06988 [Cercospora beticola]|uniref:RRM domain-containing protein n=1 Tax=Cercospora beticola TaxID=122368 RepID=A0A2G5HA78_CERBT|nr:hypothetical protein CB0940_06988 [Cercospora beticola]PIA89456.1 hypothetical protein CB0940_06988 [Cercospora beticola]WPB02909.1 hypothetical protein RHO25_007545 [Cercospora beticola]CAK1358394.1 unnamed protein product [Cercospora beticola]
MEETPRLYVGNLPYVAQKKDIETLFQQHNITVKNIDISVDPFTGRNPSYCFVDFYDRETAQHVLDTLQGENVRGRPIKINLNTKRRTASPQNNNLSSSDRKDNQNWRSQNNWRTQPNPSPTPNQAEQPPYVFDRWHRDDAHTHWTTPAEEGRRLFVGRLPRIPQYYTLELEMKTLFKDFNLQAVSKLISPPPNRQGPGFPTGHYCFVDLANAREAKKAAAMLNGAKNPYGETCIVQLARQKQGSHKVIREQLSGSL